MRCLLISPPITLNGGEICPSDMPLMLTYTASIIEKNNFDVEILDAFALNLTLNEIVQEIRNKKPDMVGIVPYDLSRQTPIEVSCTISKKLKSVFPNLFIGLLWNYDINFFVSVLKNNPSLDFVVLGEPELIMVELCKIIKDGNYEKLKKVKGIAFRDSKNGKININEKRELINDLDILPFPARHMLPLDSYDFTPHRHKHTPFMPMLASRGCPYSCEFCFHSVCPYTYRIRSVDNVIKEIEYLKEKYNVKEFQFIDRIFGLKEGWIESFCKTLIRERLDISWSCHGRANLMDKKILPKMKKAGCWNMLFGIESGCQELLNNINKKMTLKQAENAIKWTKEAGIETTASFILGLPGETPELGLKTIEFAKKIDPDYAQFFLTRIYNNNEKLKKYGKVLSWHNPRFGTIRGPVFLPNGYKNFEELKNMEKLAYKEFYLRPSFVVKRISKTKSFEELIRNIRGLKMLKDLSISSGS